MIKRNILECMTLVGKAPSHYEGAKTYVSTGAVDCDHIDYKQTEQVTYDNRPSRANLSVTSGDILFAKMCGTKKTLRINDVMAKYLFSTGFCAVRADESVMIADLLYHLLSSEQFLTQKDQNSSGATQKAITNTGLKKITIQVPDLEEQRVLAAKLDCIEQMMARRRIQIEYFDQLVKSRFIEMFGDPVENPHGFRKVALSELAEIKIGPFGSLLHKEDYIEGGHPLLNPSHIVDGKVVPDCKLTISDKKYDELKAYHLHIGDVVMGRRGEMGRCAVVPSEGFLCGTGSLLIRTKGEVTADYIQKIISFPSFRKTIEDMAVGQTMPNLNVPIVSKFQIIKPPIEVQKNYYKFVAQTDKSKLAIQKSFEKLEILKKALMQKYFG